MVCATVCHTGPNFQDSREKGCCIKTDFPVEVSCEQKICLQPFSAGAWRRTSSPS